jgi:hypothetical protein
LIGIKWRTCAPDLLLVDLLEFTREILAVGLAAIEFERAAGLATVTNRFVELETKSATEIKDTYAMVLTASKTGRLAFSNFGAQSSAPRRAVVEQAAYM